MRSMFTKFATMGIATIGIALSPLPAAAQMTEVDPNTVIDSDLDNPQPTPSVQHAVASPMICARPRTMTSSSQDGL